MADPGQGEGTVNYVPQQGDIRIVVPHDPTTGYDLGRHAYGIRNPHAVQVIYYIAGDGTVSVAPADVNRFMFCVPGCTLA